MRFNSGMPYETWSALGPRIAAGANASRWWLGDWLVFGERRYGARYRLAVAATGLDYQTLRNYAMVARRFELSRRRDSLSFQHHAEVCALSDEEQDRWLDVAAEHRWSKRELRSHLQRCRRQESSPDDRHLLRLTVEPAREERWREAAASCRCSLEEWVILALDVAAAALI
jgi:predicted HicB family RNase H-like nuclease